MVPAQSGTQEDRYREHPRAQIAELYIRLTDGNVLDSVQGLEFCTDLKLLSDTLNWEDTADFSDALSELFQTAGDMCPPTLASNMLFAVEAAVQRYSVCVADDELTCLHMALATLCGTHHLYSEFLKLFTKVSQELPPLTSPSIYFQNCSFVHAERKSWELAAMHSALALTQEQSATNWRMWVLYELIAFGKTHELPKPFQPSYRCPLVSELAMHFSTIDKATGRALLRFCSENEQVFKKQNIWPLVRRSCTAFYIRWLRLMSPYFSVISWDLLAPIMSPVSLDELLGAGLRQWFLITESSDGKVLLEPKHIERDDEKALRVLNETSLVAAQLSK